jgi:hypothetical protein
VAAALAEKRTHTLQLRIAVCAVRAPSRRPPCLVFTAQQRSPVTPPRRGG